MSHAGLTAPPTRSIALTPQPHLVPSPLMLSDRLITLAEDADRAGFRPAASRLIELAYEVMDQTTPAFA